MIDNYIYLIVALLPLSALMLVTQTNPYHALVIRAILGAIAALVYAVLGAADVALTEALVGTMLAVTLYIIAVRSSLVMRLGVLKSGVVKEEVLPVELIARFKKVISRYHLRLELVEYADLQALNSALAQQEIHGTCLPSHSNDELNPEISTATTKNITYITKIRVHRLFEILQAELAFPETSLSYIAASKSQDFH